MSNLTSHIASGETERSESEKEREKEGERWSEKGRGTESVLIQFGERSLQGPAAIFFGDDIAVYRDLTWKIGFRITAIVRRRRKTISISPISDSF